MKLSELNYKIYKIICDRLDMNSTWRDLVVATENTIYQLNDIEREKCAKAMHSGCSPSMKLLERWSSMGMSVDVLSFYLDKLKLEECLKFIKTTEPLKIKEQPAKEIKIESGEQIEIRCEATGFPYPEFVWFRGESRLYTDKIGLFVIKSARASDAGTYRCRVQHYTEETGRWFYIFSSPCRVEVQCNEIDGFPSFLSEIHSFENLKTRESMKNVATYLPQILLQPTNKVSECGGPVIFKVMAQHPTDPLMYQWFYNSKPIHNATSSELRVEDVKKEDGGSYQVRIFSSRNEKIQTMSKVAKLEVNPEPNQFVAGDKVALVIGNCSYRSYGQPLPAVEFDLFYTTEAFEKMGFKVISLLDLTLEEMKSAVEFFCHLLNADVYAIFYCMGHGFLYDNKHYLIPWDSSQGNDVKESLCIESCMKEIQTKSPRLLMLLVDLCRQQVEHSQVEEIQKEKISRSLPNYVIIYAAVLGEQSFEVNASSAPRGLFNSYLLNVLEKPDVTLNEVYGLLQSEFRKCPYDRKKFPQHPQMDITLEEPERSLWDPVSNCQLFPILNKEKVCNVAKIREIWPGMHVIPGNVHIPLDNKGLIILSFSKFLTNVLNMRIEIKNFHPESSKIEVELLKERVDQVLQPIKVNHNIPKGHLPAYKFCNLQRLENKLMISLNINIVSTTDKQTSKLETELIDLGRPLAAFLNWSFPPSRGM